VHSQDLDNGIAEAASWLLRIALHEDHDFVAFDHLINFLTVSDAAHAHGPLAD
jgi:hypothetical protein